MAEKSMPETAEPRAAESAPAPETPRPEPAATGGTSINLGIGRGYFGSLGEGETLKDEIREYYFEMVTRINERWWQRPEADDSRVGMVMVMIVVARDGKVVNCQLLRSSGRRSYDEAVVAAVQAASPLLPLPANFESDFFQAPLRVMPPLSLMRIGEGLKGAVLR
jgi:protein TonB